MSQANPPVVDSSSAGRLLPFFFAPQGPETLAIGRILFFGGLAIVFFRWDSGFWATVPQDLYFPISFFAKLHIPVAGLDVLRLLDIVWKISLLASCLGLFTRVSTATAFVLSLYLLGLPNNFGKVQLQDTLIVLAMFTLAVSKCGDAYSLDNKLFNRRPSSDLSAEYTWPQSLICTSMAWCFFAAGIAKVRHVGFDWAGAENIANMMLLMQYTGEGADSFSKSAITLAEQPRICAILGFATLAIEFAAILTPFSRYARVLVVPGLLCMQIGLWAVLGVDFTRFLLLYAFWIPWGRVIRRP